MAWRRPGDKPLSEPMMVKLLTYICITRPQWVNGYLSYPMVPPQSMKHRVPAYASATSDLREFQCQDYSAAVTGFVPSSLPKWDFHHCIYGMHRKGFSEQIYYFITDTIISYEHATEPLCHVFLNNSPVIVFQSVKLSIRTCTHDLENKKKRKKATCFVLQQSCWNKYIQFYCVCPVIYLSRFGCCYSSVNEFD